jgi:hypothetical protein
MTVVPHATQGRLSAGLRERESRATGSERPPWAVGWSNAALVKLAKDVGVSPYDYGWWEEAGLYSRDIAATGKTKVMGELSRVLEGRPYHEYGRGSAKHRPDKQLSTRERQAERRRRRIEDAREIPW